MIRYCPHCWAKNKYEALTCAACGASLDERDKDFVARLIDAIQHPEPTAAALAIEILGRLAEPRAVDALLIRLARNPDSMDVTAATATALGHIGERRAVPGLAEVLLDNKRPLPTRLAAAEALAMLDSSDAEEALRAVLNRPRIPILLRQVAELVAAKDASIP
ncbi:MAG: HEAT repeat domain-containing protein [Chloroflexota bacterium]